MSVSELQHPQCLMAVLTVGVIIMQVGEGEYVCRDPIQNMRPVMVSNTCVKQS